MVSDRYRKPELVRSLTVAVHGNLKPALRLSQPMNRDRERADNLTARHFFKLLYTASTNISVVQGPVFDP
jgi:hypothetical protein